MTMYQVILNSKLGRMWKKAVGVAGVPAKIRTHDIHKLKKVKKGEGK